MEDKLDKLIGQYVVIINNHEGIKCLFTGRLVEITRSVLGTQYVIYGDSGHITFWGGNVDALDEYGKIYLRAAIPA